MGAMFCIEPEKKIKYIILHGLLETHYNTSGAQSAPEYKILSKTANFHGNKANRYYKVRFYPLCVNRSYSYPWSSD